jgi:hypothetical protein
MTQVDLHSTNAVHVAWSSEPKHYYDLWRSTNLVNGFDVRLGVNLPATPPMNVYTDKTANGNSVFYRIEAK